MTVSISGSIRVDLTAPEGVHDGDLFIGERAYSALWKAISGAAADVHVDLWVGDARRVFWIDARTFNLLNEADSVLISGSDCRGVEDATAGLRQALGKDAA